jgi:hypothetical protein
MSNSFKAMASGLRYSSYQSSSSPAAVGNNNAGQMERWRNGRRLIFGNVNSVPFQIL